MRANRLTDGSILDTDTRRGRTDCDISRLFFFIYIYSEMLLRQVALCECG